MGSDEEFTRRCFRGFAAFVRSRNTSNFFGTGISNPPGVCCVGSSSSCCVLIVSPRRRGICIFCGGGPTTEEHAIPDWASRLLHHHGPFLETVSGRPDRITPKIKLTTNSVCDPCNTGWMHDLEDAVSPLLKPMIERPPASGWVQLNQQRQRAVALWALKTSFTLDQALPGIPDFPDWVRSRLWQDQEVGTNVAVWLAAYAGQRHAIRVTRKSFIDKEDLVIGKDGERNRFPTDQAVSVTLTLRRVVVQTFVYYGKGFAQLNLNSPWDAGLIRVWPEPDRVALWPKHKLAFDDAKLWEFAHRGDHTTAHYIPELPPRHPLQ